MTEVKIIADSMRYGAKERITTFLVKFPRFIEPELLRHRMFSFSAASSRAINMEKHISRVDSDYFCPAPFTKDCKGMSAKESITGVAADHAVSTWRRAKQQAIQTAHALRTLEVHKQHASRILQPFEYTEYLITATEFQNFWNLRCPQYITEAGNRYKSKKELERYMSYGYECENTSQAQPEIQELAELMYNAYVENEPVLLHKGQWHIPFGDNIPHSFSLLDRLLIASARMARISYLQHDGTQDFNADLNLSKRLQSVEHWSVFEHCARTMDALEFSCFIKGDTSKKPQLGTCNNLVGFIPFRYALENQYKF